MTIREWTEKHPKATKVIKVVVCCAGVACGTACLYHAVNQSGIRIEITTREIRELRAADLGYAENLKNGALGTEARGLDASKIWARYTTIVEPFVA